MPGTATDTAGDTGASARRRERLRLIGLAAASTVVAVAVALLVAGALVDRREEPADVADIGLTPVRPGLIGEDPSGDAAPDIAFTYFDGREGSLADFAGRPLVVNFFASWCPPCEEELPAFAAVHRELGGEVAFLGLDVNDTVESGQATADAAGVTYDLATDPASGELFQALGGTVMPYTVFVSADQRVVEVHRGPMSASELEDVVRDRFLS